MRYGNPLILNKWNLLTENNLYAHIWPWESFDNLARRSRWWEGFKVVLLDVQYIRHPQKLRGSVCQEKTSARPLRWRRTSLQFILSMGANRSGFPRCFVLWIRQLFHGLFQFCKRFSFLSAILFYLPRVMWLMLEGGLMKYLGKGATGRIVEESEDRLNQLIQVKIQIRVSTKKTQMTWRTWQLFQVFKDNLQNRYNRYAMAFFLCEVLNVLIVVGNFFLTNLFLDDQFLLYGPNVLRWTFCRLMLGKSLVLTIQVFFHIGFTAYLKKSLTYKDWSTQCAMYSPELQGAPFTSMELGEDRIVSFSDIDLLRVLPHF